MSRAIIVLTTGRSGSSAVAGALHHLGVFMTAREHTAGFGHKNHRGGHWEDLRWHKLGLEIVASGFPYQPTLAQALRYEELAAERSSHPLWGIKTPTLSFLLPALLSGDIFPHDTRVVCVHRTFVSAVHSRQEKDRPRLSRQDSELAQARAVLAQLRSYEASRKAGLAVYHLSFEHLLADPPKYVRDLQQFVYTGLSLPRPPAAVAAAERFIRPDYVRY